MSALPSRSLPHRANLTLTGSRDYPRRLTLELCSYGFLCAVVYAKDKYVSQASDAILACYAIRTPVSRALFIGRAAFPLTAAEWDEAIQLLEPLGLRVEERPS